MKIKSTRQGKMLGLRLRGSRILAVVGSAAVMTWVLLGTANIAGAHSGDSGNPNLIHACVATKDGITRIVGPTGSCSSKETPLHWAGPPSVDALENTPCHAGTLAAGTTHIEFDANTRQVLIQCVPDAQFLLTVQVTNSGHVESTPAGISCQETLGTCSAEFDPLVSVTLTESPVGLGIFFLGWGGACSGTSPTCTVTMDAVKTVTATFSGL